eukprot:10310778-Lingulodinium_polyedra.AAC.1
MSTMTLIVAMALAPMTMAPTMIHGNYGNHVLDDNGNDHGATCSNNHNPFDTQTMVTTRMVMTMIIR